MVTYQKHKACLSNQSQSDVQLFSEHEAKVYVFNAYIVLSSIGLINSFDDSVFKYPTRSSKAPERQVIKGYFVLSYKNPWYYHQY